MIPFFIIGGVLGVTSFIKNKNKENEATVIEEEIQSAEKQKKLLNNICRLIRLK